ncbi:hypothetical protein [Lentilactobacillus sunkii]|nr:hypothetical protein [Lentilactobacillus sunkii]
MTKRYALTYEFNWNQGFTMANVNVYDSGSEALRQLHVLCRRMFPETKNMKEVSRIPKDGEVTCGFPFRGIAARYLTDAEIKIYKLYGNQSLIDQKQMMIVSPVEEADK